MKDVFKNIAIALMCLITPAAQPVDSAVELRFIAMCERNIAEIEACVAQVFARRQLYRKPEIMISIDFQIKEINSYGAFGYITNNTAEDLIQKLVVSRTTLSDLV